jgi:CCR4-NOT transcription complex subunit 9
MVNNLLEKPSARLLKHIIRCYNRLAENPRAKIALKDNMPLILKESKLVQNLDESSKKCLKNLCDLIKSSDSNDNVAFEDE